MTSKTTAGHTASPWKAGLKAGSDKNRNKTHCKRGHPLSGDNLYIAPKNGSRQCKACRNAANKKYKETATLSEPQARRLIAGLNEGKTLNNLIYGEVGRRGYVKGLQVVPSYKVFNNTCRANPKFARLIRKLAEKNAHAARVAGRRSQIIIAAPAIMRDNGKLSFNAIHAATRDLPPGIRQDVEGEMFIALAEGRLKIAEIPARAREFVRAQNRADRNSVFNLWGHLSLDKPLNEDSDATFMDVIREDQRLWG